MKLCYRLVFFKKFLSEKSSKKFSKVRHLLEEREGKWSREMEGANENVNGVYFGSDPLSTFLLPLKRRDSAQRSRIAELEEKLKKEQMENERLKSIVKSNEADLLIAKETASEAEIKAKKVEEELNQYKKRTQDLIRTCKSYVDESNRAYNSKRKMIQELTKLGCCITPMSREESPTFVNNNDAAAGPSSALIDATSPLPKRRAAQAKKVSGARQDENLVVCGFPEWYTEIMPKRRPYFPQIGDELVYLWQGHKLYTEEVTSKKIYPLSRKMNMFLPYKNIPLLLPEELVRVVHIDFELKPYRLVILKLEKIYKWDSKGMGEYLYVGYHYLPSAADFLVFKKIWGRKTSWKVGDRFRYMTDRTWRLGEVRAENPFDPWFPSSRFRKFEIKWYGNSCNEPERLSPWDMEEIPDDFIVPQDANDGVPVTDEEFQQTNCMLVGKMCPKYKTVIGLVGAVMKLPVAQSFLGSVDWSARPDLAKKIAYPIDLSTIKARLDNLFYRRLEAIQTDVDRILIIAKQLNETDSLIAKHARVIREFLLEIITEPDFCDPEEAFHRLMVKYCGNDTSSAQKERMNMECSSAKLPD